MISPADNHSSKIPNNYTAWHIEYGRPYIDAFHCLQFKDPLIMLLLSSAFVSICMKQFDDAISITVVGSARQGKQHTLIPQL